MKKYMIYIEYKDGLGGQEFADGYKELKEKLKDIHGYKDYDYIDVNEIIENDNGELDFYLTNYK